jgi:hypothetical protein
MYESGTRLSGEVVDDLTSYLEAARGTDVPWSDARIFSTMIRRNVKLAECPSYGQSIFEYEPRCNGAIDYLALADEYLAEMIDEPGDLGASTSQADATPAPTAKASASPTVQATPVPEATKLVAPETVEAPATPVAVKVPPSSSPAPGSATPVERAVESTHPAPVAAEPVPSESAPVQESPESRSMPKARPKAASRPPRPRRKPKPSPANNGEEAAMPPPRIVEPTRAVG